MIKNKYNKGFSVIEVLIVIGVFAIVTISVAIFAVDTFRFSENNSQRVSSITYIQEITNALLIYKTSNWDSIIESTDDGQKSLVLVDNRYELTDGATTENGFTNYFEVNSVYRNDDGDIVESGGNLDPNTRAIDITVEWTDSEGNIQQQTTTTYVNAWGIDRHTQTTEADFNAGELTNTFVVANGDGEVGIERVFFPDWCNPTLAINEYDIPGNATALSVFARPGFAFMGTDGETVGESFTKVNISGVDPPIVEVEGSFDNYVVNDIYVQGDYAYFATNRNRREITILDISSVPYQEVGYFNADGTDNAQSVAVVGDVGYVAHGRYVSTFDVSSKSGRRPELDTIYMAIWWFPGVPSQIKVVDDYLYASMDWDWYELVIVDVSDPSDLWMTTRISVNDQQTQDIQVTDDGTRTYFGTNSSYEDEVFIIDTTSKFGNLPIIASVDTSPTNIEGVAIIEEDNRFMAVGSGGDEYLIFDIEDESNPDLCGTMDVPNGVNDIDSVEDEEGNAFSYIMTGDTDSEFKILRGGPGGGGADGYSYFDEGTFISSVMDSLVDNVKYFSIDWVESLPEDTDLQIQLRADDDPDPSSEDWVGPDGTSNTYFTNPFGQETPDILDGNRYIQYKIEFETSSQTDSAFLEQINIYLEEQTDPTPTPTP